MRDWATAFIAAGPAGLIDREPPANAPELGEARGQALAQIIEPGPDPERHGVVRWWPRDLAAWIHSTFGISLDEVTVCHTAKELGFAKPSARKCHHEQDPAALTASKRT